MSETIKTGLLTRTLSFTYERAEDEDDRTIDVAFSSEEPVERWFGTEVLGHKKGEVNLSRMEDGRAPALLNHDPGQQIGVVENVRVGSDRIGRARLRFGRGAFASEIFQDVKDGIRSQVSVGYMVDEMELVRSVKDGPDEYRATAWTPMEVSIASIAADPTVGVGRSSKYDDHETRVVRAAVVEEEEPMADNEPKTVEVQVTREPTAEELAAATQSQRDSESNRVREIAAIGAQWKLDEAYLQDAIKSGKTVDEVRQHVLDKKLEEMAAPSQTGSPDVETPEIGMSRGEVEKYSIVRAISSIIEGTWEKAGGLEREASLAAEEQLGVPARGFYIPYDVQLRGDWGQREATKAGSGGNLVATDLMAANFIDLLRNRMVTSQAGITMLPGLVGDVAIPRQTVGITNGSWVGEGGANTDGDLTFDQVTLAPTTYTHRSGMSRRLMKQSTPAIEGLVRDDMVRANAIAIDLAVLHGSGAANQPQGVFGATGVGTETYTATNGTTEFQSVIALESNVAADNADLGSLAYITTPEWRGRLKGTFRDAGSGREIWEGAGAGLGPQEMNGYRAFATNQVAKNLGLGTDEHAMFFGNWADVLLGMWGTLDILVDQYTLATQGGLVIHTFQDVNVALRHGESFATTQFAV